MPNAKQFIPQARSVGLIVTDLDDEIIVYDKERDKAHCLNQTAALVWKYSNGKRSVTDIAVRMQNNLHSRVDDQMVWYALRQLEQDHLLRGEIAVPRALAGITRREFVKQAGKAAVAIAVPVVISMTAPQPALAGGSCIPNGQQCSSGTQCCSGCCTAGATQPGKAPGAITLCQPATNCI